MRRPTYAATVIALPLAIVGCTAEAPEHATNTAGAIEDLPRVVSTEYIGPFVGHDAPLDPANAEPIRIAFYGTDLGFSYRHGDKIEFLFGDSWATEEYSPIEASSGFVRDDTYGSVAISRWPDGRAISSASYPTLLLPQHPGSAEMYAIDNGHALDLGKTPMGGWSTGKQQFALFNSTKPIVCSAQRLCPGELTCDIGLGYFGADPTVEPILTLPCADGSPLCTAATIKDTAESGLCVDTGSSIYGSSDAGRIHAAALDVQVGTRDPAAPHRYLSVHSWPTNRFVNVAARVVAAMPIAGGTADYREDGALGGSKVLLWGRPAFVGVGANGRPSALYFAYADAAAAAGDRWNPRYFAGLDGKGKPLFSDRESDAVPLDLDSTLPGSQPAAEVDIINQMTFVWLPSIRKWTMVYGGGLGTLPITLLPKCGVLQLFAHDECDQVDAGSGAIRIRFADNPWGPWSPPQDLLVGGDPATASHQYGPGGSLHHSLCEGPGCATHTHTPNYRADEYGFLYGANIIPEWSYVDGNSIYLTWNASTWDPYRVVLYKSRLDF